MTTTTRLTLWIALIVAAVGIADAVFLTVEHFRGVVPPCTVVHGCGTVLTSAYATIAGVPISLLGVGYYGFLFVFILLVIKRPAAQMIRWLRRVSWIGLLTSAWLMYVQFGVLKAICLYCLVSAATSLMLFALVHLAEPATEFPPQHKE